jgi:hypothetical protein
MEKAAFLASAMSMKRKLTGEGNATLLGLPEANDEKRKKEK